MPKYRPEESNPEGTLIRDIPIESINPFPNHPYKVKDDEAMQELIERSEEHTSELQSRE